MMVSGFIQTEDDVCMNFYYHDATVFLYDKVMNDYNYIYIG